MEKRIYPSLNEVIYWDKLPNGLTIAVIPRGGFSKKMAYFVFAPGIYYEWRFLPGTYGRCPFFGA